MLVLGLMGLASVMSAFSSRMQAATLFVGKSLCPPEIVRDMPRGFQDAITPRWQNTLNIVVPLMVLTVLVIGSMIVWWGGPLACLATLIVLQPIALRVVPEQLSFYLIRMINNMANRMADYKKERDSVRADAAKEMLDRLTALYSVIQRSGMPVPSFKEIRTMSGSNQSEA